jgi:D-threo-aldose 1-dehydrogenase
MNALAADTPLGRKGLRVGAMAYGVAALGNLLRPVPQQEWEGAVPAAWEGGVRYFDVAPHYGLGLAERRLGLGLRGRPRDEFLISTKVQPGHGRGTVRRPPHRSAR